MATEIRANIPMRGVDIEAMRQAAIEGFEELGVRNVKIESMDLWPEPHDTLSNQGLNRIWSGTASAVGTLE